MKRYKKNEIEELARVLKNDGVISVPTDTVYGLCAIINNNKAFDKLVSIKNRPANKSFPVVCANIEQIKNIAKVNDYILKIIHAFMPGPITLVLLKKQNAFINNRGLNETEEIAVRMAPTKELKELILKVGSPLFLTSANLSGKLECRNLDEIESTFPNLDGMMEGDISYGVSSTIIDCTNDTIKIQRPGPIKEEQILDVLKK